MANEIQEAMHAEANRIRALHGARPLQLENRLCLAAQNQAEYMAARRRLSHDDNGGLGGRVRAAGYEYASVRENVAFGYADVPALFRGWYESPGHRENLLAVAQDAGYGRAIAIDGDWYCCAVFALPALRVVPSPEPRPTPPRRQGWWRRFAAWVNALPSSR